MDALLRRRLMMQQGGGPTPPPAPQPVFYQRLKFDGTAYIDIPNYTLPDNASMTVALGEETTKAGTQWAFCTTSLSPVGVTGQCLGGGTTSTNRQIIVYYDSTNYINGNNAVVYFSYPRYSFFLGPKHYGWGNVGHNITKGSSKGVGLRFGSNRLGANLYTGTLSDFKIYGSDAQDVNDYSVFNNYTPVEIFRPCLYNGEAGMWQVSNGTFHGNSAGAGTLTVAGDIVTP